MAQREVFRDIVKVSQDEHTVLTVCGEYVTASYNHSTWIVQPTSSDNDKREFAMIYVPDDRLAFTLSTAPDPTGAYNILAKELNCPPSMEQCWTMEDEEKEQNWTMDDEKKNPDPRKVKARLQSVAMNKLSVATQGDVGAMGLPVSGFPISSGKQMTWTFEYQRIQ